MGMRGVKWVVVKVLVCLWISLSINQLKQPKKRQKHLYKNKINFELNGNIGGL